MQLLARTRFFGGGHLSGLDPEALGAVYRGRAQFRAPVAATRRAAARRAGARAARRNAVRRSPNASRPSSPGAARRRRGRLMRSMNEFGNDLYTGKTSFPFVGRRRLWFIIAAILVIGAALVPLFRPIQFSIEFTGGRSSP
jgi:hypothetical protein